MVLRIGNDSVVFIVDETITGVMDCAAIRGMAESYLHDRERHGDEVLEIRTFYRGGKQMVFATYVPDRTCKELYSFADTFALLDAFESDNRSLKGELLCYRDTYYAALFEKTSHSLSEYANVVENAKNYYLFLSEHGTMVSRDFVFPKNAGRNWGHG